jgi:hypothetical protein
MKLLDRARRAAWMRLAHGASLDELSLLWMLDEIKEFQPRQS